MIVVLAVVVIVVMVVLIVVAAAVKVNIVMVLWNDEHRSYHWTFPEVEVVFYIIHSNNGNKSMYWCNRCV